MPRLKILCWRVNNVGFALSTLVRPAQVIYFSNVAQCLFELALDLPEADRLDFIESQCDDKELFEQLNHLLDNEQKESSFIEKLLGTPNQPDIGIKLVGETLGIFRISEKQSSKFGLPISRCSSVPKVR